MRPINIDELKAGFRGKPYNALVQRHVKRQSAQKLAEGIEGTKAMCPKEMFSDYALDLFDDFFDYWNSRAYDASFWREDCSEVFTQIIDDAEELILKIGLKPDDETLFNVFQIVTMSFALAASLQPKMRKFAGIKKGLFS